jgi:hypothetical protein
MKLNDKTVEQLKDFVEIQGETGNWDYDEYMHGMYNGMELMLATMENREPDFRSRPDKFITEVNGD